jgi:signal transduction histidine kinase
MDLGKLLAKRTLRLGFAVACALALCLVVLAFLNTQAQQRQNKNLIESAARAALAIIANPERPTTIDPSALPGLAPQQSSVSTRARDEAERLSQAVIERVSQESEKLTLSHELRENAGMAAISFAAFLAFSGLLIALQKKTIRSALAPVQGMVKELEAFEAGDLERRLPEVPLKELDSVSRSFNHLAESLQASINSQERLSRQLIEMRQHERLNLARDLHDDLGQTLTAAAIEIEAARIQTERLPEGSVHFERIENSLDRARQSLRHLTANLRGESSKDSILDFSALLQFWKIQHPEVQWDLSTNALHQLKSLRSEDKAVAFRILQESLTNVFKHSEARACKITFSLADDARGSTESSIGRLDISNDGLLVQQRNAQSLDTTGFGIEGMRERAHSIQAHFRAGLASDGLWHVRLERGAQALGGEL